MHRAVPVFLLSVGLAAAAPAEENTPALSEHIAGELRAALPKYDPAAHAAKSRTLDKVPVDPDVIVLPKMEVREKRTPRVDADEWMRREALRRRIKRDYLASMDGLTGVLNGWSIPLLTPSVSARAQAAYRAEKIMNEANRLLSIGEALNRIDPQAGREIREDLELAVTGRAPARR